MTALYHSCDTLPKSLGHFYFNDFMFFTVGPQTDRGSSCFRLEGEFNLADVTYIDRHDETPKERKLVKAAISETRRLARNVGIKVSLDEAADFLAQRRAIENFRDDEGGVDWSSVGEAGWAIQVLAAQLAVDLGFDGCITPDEMGDSRMIKMTPEMLASMSEVDDDELEYF